LNGTGTAISPISGQQNKATHTLGQQNKATHTLHVYAFAIKSMVHCGSAFELGISRLPYYCTPSVRDPDVIGALAVWRQNNKQNKKTYRGSWYVIPNQGLLKLKSPRIYGIRHMKELIITKHQKIHVRRGYDINACCIWEPMESPEAAV